MALTEEGRALKRAYEREYYRKNREKRKAQIVESWNRRAEKLKEQAAKEGGQDK